jgi:hypothetical protein
MMAPGAGGNRRYLAASIVIAASWGCSSGPKDVYVDGVKRGISTPIADVPSEAAAAAKKRLPNVTFDSAFTVVDKEGNIRAYDVRGKDPQTGKIHDVRVDLAGNVIQTE